MHTSAQAPQADPIRVLVVDDSPTFLHSITEFLRRFPELTLVGSLPNGKEALAQAPALRPHIILIDLDMPGLSGLETIPQLRAQLPQAGIIALTLLNGRAYRQAALNVGADDFVSKANLVAELLSTIQKVIKLYQTPAKQRGNHL